MPGSAPGGPPPPTAMKPPRDEAPGPSAAAPNSGDPPPSQTLQPAARAPTAAAAAAPPPPAAGALPSGSPQQQYNYAFNLLHDADYPGAERALRDFVQRNPTNRAGGQRAILAGRDLLRAPRLPERHDRLRRRLQGLPRSPKGRRQSAEARRHAGGAGRKPDACAVFAQLDQDYPARHRPAEAPEPSESARRTAAGDRRADRRAGQRPAPSRA